MSAIRNPSPFGLLLSIVLAVPFAWPVTLYTWLRFAAGHRSAFTVKRRHRDEGDLLVVAYEPPRSYGPPRLDEPATA